MKGGGGRVEGVGGIWGVQSSIGQQNSAELALVQAKVSRVSAAHPTPRRGGEHAYNGTGMWNLTVTAMNLKHNRLTVMLLQMDFPQKGGEPFSGIQAQTKSRGAQKCLALENHTTYCCCPILESKISSGEGSHASLLDTITLQQHFWFEQFSE